jgi:hypothetical protein
MIFRDLDEYRDEELEAELKQRREDRMRGVCDYCHRPTDTKPCRYPRRHSRPRATVDLVP